jgi:hypothetical protein
MILVTADRGWDVAVYYRAMQALRVGLDPYAVGLARQYAANAAVLQTYTYVYPPITLLVLRIFNFLPLWLAAGLYWIAYVAGCAGIAWAAVQCFRPQDRFAMQFLIPLAIFFPGLLSGGVIMSGNIAYIFYGAILPAAVLGYKRNCWRWFYLAVFLAAGCKAPLLTLLAIPLLAGKRQGRSSAAVAAGGLGLFAVQSWIWPVQFSEYLTGVSLQFKFNADFGLSPAGSLGLYLYRHGLPYSSLTTAVFLVYAGLLFATLYYFSTLYHRSRITPETWLPVLLVGTILLNPRILEYDLHAVALPMMLIVLRAVCGRVKAGMAVAFAVLFILALDLCGVSSEGWDRLRGMLVLVAVLGCGLHSLMMEVRQTFPAAESIVPSPEPLPEIA